MLKQHQGLRDLKERRRREQTEAKLADSKPLEDILESLFKKTPTLANLFLKGVRASNPFKTIKVREEEDDENDYFGRATETGQFSLFIVSAEHRIPVTDYVGPNLQNGIGTLSVQLPLNCQVGDAISFLAVVTDSSRLDPFENRFIVRVRPAAQPSGEPTNRRKPPSGEKGDDREVAAGIALPNIIEVNETDWDKQTPPFNKYTALRIKNAGMPDENGGNGDAKPVYDFYVNMDNLYLKTEIKPLAVVKQSGPT